jgi:GTPase SAR1 family protein
MSRTKDQASILAERLCWTQRIGVFGHRGVGKTTLLTMLYREAVGGRLPDLRLAAADAPTAEYLAEKVLQLEAGQPLPATLAETDLHFHLYHSGRQIDLLLKDYQGEHVALGRQEPIRDFLRDCDAVWLCLDVTVAGSAGECLGAQQEVEQLVEDYLAAQTPGTPHRPMALVLTKADLLGLPEQTSAFEYLVQKRLGMTRHALQTHCPHHAILAVSSLGHSLADTPTSFQPKPIGLEGPLTWLAQGLQDQDQARLEQIWELAPNNVALLQRCVACFARRYPNTPTTRAFQVRLRRLRRQKLQRQVLTGLVGLLALVLSLWVYDALGQSSAQQFAADHASDPEAVYQHWLSYQTWHPTRHLFLSEGAHAEVERLRDLQQQARERRAEQRLAELKQRAADPDADSAPIWKEFQQFRDDYPERNIDEEVKEFRDALKARHDAESERKAQRAHEQLLFQEGRSDLTSQIARAEQFLRDHGETRTAGEVRKRLADYLRRQEEQAIESARSYSARNPFNFQTRQENYQKYLQHYPRGTFAREAREAIESIVQEWDRHDFRKVRDQYQEGPGELKDLDVLCRAYLAGHPDGRYREYAQSLLRWSERVRGEGEYKVTLKSGSFDPKMAGYFSKMNLSVELEVNGVLYGPSTIARKTSEPEWDYAFPRPIRWKLGDSVRIKVTDNYYWKRKILDVSSDEKDPLAMKMLSGTVNSGKNSLVFESDFNMPVLPPLE